MPYFLGEAGDIVENVKKPPETRACRPTATLRFLVITAFF